MAGVIELQHRDGATWVTLSGDIDMALVDAFDGDLNAHAEAVDVAVDLAEVQFMDSCGLAVLIRTYNAARTVRLVNVPLFVDRLLAVAGATDLFAA